MTATKMSAEDLAKLLLSTGQHTTSEADAVRLLEELKTNWLREALPAWEAVYEPGNVSDYLIGYTNDEAAAKGAAEAWLKSQKDEVGRLEWVPDTVLVARSEYDQWFELIEHHDDGIPTGPGLIVRRLRADEAGA